VNAENLRKVAHELRQFPPGYDQRTWIETTDEDCGTRACVGGHAELIMLRERGHAYDPDSCGIEQGAIERWLGLTMDQARTLFGAYPEIRSTGRAWPEPFGLRYREAITGRSPESAAHVAADLLDALADGTVTL
jgi:hypothetical protein